MLVWTSSKKTWATHFFCAVPVRPPALVLSVALSMLTHFFAEVTRQKPDVQSNLLTIYGLGGLHRSVARLDPNTGEKINKLRKSYEGQIKQFQLAGRNKPDKVDRDNGGMTMRQAIGNFDSETFGIIHQSDEEWNAEHAQRKIGMTEDFKAKLRKAVQMQPGRVRNEQKWDDVLGHDKARPAAPTPAVAAQSGHLRPNGVARTVGQSAADLKRQTRGKKRSYGDESFIGYGEGYSEPEDVDPDGEYGSDDGNRKKRRKV